MTHHLIYFRYNPSYIEIISQYFCHVKSGELASARNLSPPQTMPIAGKYTSPGIYIVVAIISMIDPMYICAVRKFGISGSAKPTGFDQLGNRCDQLCSRGAGSSLIIASGSSRGWVRNATIWTYSDARACTVDVLFCFSAVRYAFGPVRDAFRSLEAYERGLKKSITCRPLCWPAIAHTERPKMSHEFGRFRTFFGTVRLIKCLSIVTHQVVGVSYYFETGNLPSPGSRGVAITQL